MLKEGKGTRSKGEYFENEGRDPKEMASLPVMLLLPLLEMLMGNKMTEGWWLLSEETWPLTGETPLETLETRLESEGVLPRRVA